MINGTDNTIKSNSVEGVLNEKLTKIKEYYAGQYNVNKEKLSEDLNKAVKVIQAYVNALKLDDPLSGFGSCKRSYHKDQNIKYTINDKKIQHITPYLNKYSGFKKIKFDGIYFSRTEESQNDTYRVIQYHPTFTYYDGRLYISDLKIFESYSKDDERAKPQDITQYTYGDFEEHCKWLKQRLGTLVEIPDEELFNKLNKHKPVFYEALN